MKKILLTLLLITGLSGSGLLFAQTDFQNQTSSDWTSLFGLGYNPNHFYNGKVDPKTTNYDSFNTHDSLMVPIDLPAIKKAGFNSVRIYGGSPLTVIRTIQTAANLGMGVVWTIGMPPSASGQPSSDPPDSSTATYKDFKQVVDYANTNTQFGKDFKNAVKIIVVWNEKIFNKGENSNLESWIKTIGAYVHSTYPNLPISTAAPTGVWLGQPGSATADRSGVLKAIVDANPNITNIPVLCHMYPFQWGNIYYDSSGSPDIDTTKPVSPYGIHAMKMHFKNPPANTTPQWSIKQSVTDASLQNSIAWDLNRLKSNFTSYQNEIVTNKKFKIVIGETGWASNGYDQNYNSYGYVLEKSSNLSKVKGNLLQAAEYAQEVYKYCKTNNIPVLYFMAMDVPWKPGSQKAVADNAEANYGIFDTWGKMKPSQTNSGGTTYNFYPSNGTKADVSINYSDYTIIPYNPGAAVIPYTTVVKYTQGGNNLKKTFTSGVDTSAGKTFFGMTEFLIKSGDTVQIFNSEGKNISSKHTLVTAQSASPLDPPHVGGTWNPTGIENSINWSNGNSTNTSGINLPATEPPPYTTPPPNSQMFHATLFHSASISNSSITIVSTSIPGYTGTAIKGTLDSKDSNSGAGVFTNLYFADNGTTTYSVTEGGNTHTLTINATNSSIISSTINGLNVNFSKTGTGFWDLNVPQP